jgi:hypothetical protein
MERLNPGPHEEPEQDKATSRLLESSNYRSPTITDRDSSFHNINIAEPYVDERKAFTGYDDDDVHALHGTAYKSERNPAVLWNGLPHYLLTGELLGIALSLCFLGAYGNPRSTSWLYIISDKRSSGSMCRFASRSARKCMVTQGHASIQYCALDMANRVLRCLGERHEIFCRL